MTEQSLERMARRMLHSLAEAAPRPDVRESLQRFKARVRRERRRRLVRQLGMIAGVLVILVGSLISVRPHYAQFSWQRFILNLGGKVGSLITGQQSHTTLVPHGQPTVDLKEIRDDIPFAPNIPSWLPSGTTIAGASVLPLTGSTATLVMTFQTVEQKSFTIKETNSSMTAASTTSYNPETASTIPVAIGSVEGVLVRYKDKDTRTLIFPGEGMRITIEGNIAQEEMIRMATSMVK